MKHTLSRWQEWQPTRSDVWLVAAYWLVVVPVLLVQYGSDTAWPWTRTLPVVAVTVAFDTLTVAALVGGLLPQFLGRRWWLGLALLPVFVLLSGWLYLSIYGELLHKAQPLNWGRVLLGAVAHAKSYGLLAVLLTGKRYFDSQKNVLRLRQAQTENELRSLKAQLDPHFLFNNLNVLRGLMEYDPASATEFVNRLAALYRFLIRYKDYDWVPLSEELQFLDGYVYLLQQRFGAAYEFRQEVMAADLGQLLVVPGTLQLLVENAVKHNAGDDDAPLLITVRASPTTLTVEHPRRPKLTAVDSLGTGLANLRERYRLLLRQDIVVRDTAASFAVEVPLVAPISVRRPANIPLA
ncbi:histidine kinase [Hymenobacter sp. ASUV-10]|uniref:Histidine kinase n=1 Tax=Hymenobacter aranciens TaxID=3063996 RepID=A0ABT9BAT8_9BACT|nr:histidine kinase [Hymenobacter sp. ASUV-10]MDO7875386.1 histidine kinase [Hymenobacter sp. ASUV-10]